jgi:small subunit ribosomal protein S21
MKKFYHNDRDRKKNEPEVEGTAVALRDGESADSLIRRFRRVVEQSGVLKELKRREFHMPKAEKKRDKQRKARKRRLKAERMAAKAGTGDSK